MRADDWLTTAEAAALLGYSDKSRVRQLVLSGKLPATRHGRDLVLRREDVLAFAHSRGQLNADKRGRPFRVPKV
jgi:excisionase family DNA binding protein